jgi:hypothetical protein
MDADKPRKAKRPVKVTDPESADVSSREAMIAVMARMIRRLFVGCYRAGKMAREGVASEWGARHIPHWDGGDTEHGYRKPVWPRIAALCLDELMEPAVFVQAQFERAGEDLPYPDHLLRESARLNYRTHVKEAAARLRELLVIERRNFRHEARWRALDRGMDPNEAARSALRDTTFDVSPLFRYSTAAGCGDAETAALFYEAALQQYAFQRDVYDAEWRDAIDDRLRAGADAFLAAIRK